MNNNDTYYEAVKCVLIAFIITIFLCSLMRPIVISGESMEPTFSEGDYVIVLKTAKIEKGDVIVFAEDGTYLIKRVIGADGDKITFADDKVYCNGEAFGKGSGEDTLVKGFYVMGDNRDNSRDSRMFGCIEKKQILGEVKLRIYPHPQIFS